MKISNNQLKNNPEFYQFLCRVCEETTGDVLYNTHTEIDHITNEEDYKDKTKAFSIKYRLVYLPMKNDSNAEQIEYSISKSHIIDNLNWTWIYNMIEKEVKMILRDNKLNELGI
jgi:hypothetical protein